MPVGQFPDPTYPDPPARPTPQERNRLVKRLVQIEAERTTLKPLLRFARSEDDVEERTRADDADKLTTSSRKRKTAKGELRRRTLDIRRGNDKNTQAAEAWTKAVEVSSDEEKEQAQSIADMNTNCVVNVRELPYQPNGHCAGLRRPHKAIYSVSRNATKGVEVHIDDRLRRVLKSSPSSSGS